MQSKYNINPAPMKRVIHRRSNQKNIIGDKFKLSVFNNISIHPDIEIINALKMIISAGMGSQRSIAKDVGISQTKMSQYINMHTRAKGWRNLNALLMKYINNTTCIIDGKVYMRDTKHEIGIANANAPNSEIDSDNVDINVDVNVDVKQPAFKNVYNANNAFPDVIYNNNVYYHNDSIESPTSSHEANTPPMYAANNIYIDINNANNTNMVNDSPPITRTVNNNHWCYYSNTIETFDDLYNNTY